MDERKIMIPNKFLIITKQDDKEIMPLLKETKRKNIIWLHYNLMRIRCHNGEVLNVLSTLCDLMGYSKRKESVDSLKNDLMILQNLGYIKQVSTFEPVDFETMRLSDKLRFNYNPFDYVDGNIKFFFTVDISVVDKIDNVNAFNLYCYLYCRMYKLNNKTAYNLYGEYEICMPSYKELVSMLIIAKRTIPRLLEMLLDNKFIYYDNAGNYRYNNTIRSAPNTYIITDRFEYKNQVKQSIKFYKQRTTEMKDYVWLK